MGIVVTDEAIEAARVAFNRLRLGQPRASVDAVRAAIKAALPHLTDAGEPLADPDVTGFACNVKVGDRLDRFCACGHIVAVHRRDGACDLCSMPTGGKDFERVQLSEWVPADTGPTDYEVWRDALQLAAMSLGGGAVSEDVITVAEDFEASLNDHRPSPPQQFCPDCGRKAWLD